MESEQNIVIPNNWTAILVVGVALLTMPLFIATPFFFREFMCRYYCSGRNIPLMSVSVIANVGITLAYFGIPFSIFRAMQTVQGVRMKLGPVAILFILFIFLCGLTHALQALAWFHAYYILMAYVETITAIASLFTLWRLAFVVVREMEAEKYRVNQMEEENKFMRKVIKDYNIKWDSENG